MPPLANAVICTTPVVTTDEEELDTDDELRDEELTDDGPQKPELQDEWVLWLDDDRLLADVPGTELLVLGTTELLLDTLLDDTGTTTLV